MRDVRTIILAAVSRRDLCYVSENKGFRFAKTKLIHADSAFIAHRIRAHFCFTNGPSKRPQIEISPVGP